GDNVTLSCNYIGLVYNLQWYWKYVGSRPEFLILVNENSESSEPSLHLSAKASKDKKQVNLAISSAEVSDSALYYCALRPTVTDSRFQSGAVYNLLWYRQYQRSKPELLLSITESGVPVKADPSAHWFSAKVDKQRKLMELEISPAKVTDSAQYYCALKPTVTGKPLPQYTKQIFC
ncbi:hypothetical protein PO909_031052, partial [Leuciscus waleckii]